MSKEIKLFGITIRKGSVALKAGPTTTARARAGRVIKRQAKREVSYQIADIKAALTLAKNVDAPDRSKMLQIYDYIVKDAHLKSQMKTAKFKVLAEPFILYNADTPDDATSLLFRKKWMSKIIAYILEAEMYGFTVLELDGLDPATFNIASVEKIEREYISIEKQWILIEGNINGSYLPYADIMNEIDLLEFGEKDDYGCLLECTYNVIWKYYSRSDWSRGSEKFGMPILSIEADTNNDNELDAIEAKASSFGTDGYIVTQKGDKATFIERTGAKMHDIWFDNIKYCDEQISKNINGQTATSDVKAFAGAAQVQERTMDDFTFARLQNICDEVNEKLIPYLRLKGFKIPEGLTYDYPTLKREREHKINGIPTVTDAPPPPNEDPKNTDPKKKK